MRTVTRWLDRLGLNRIRNFTPDGENLRQPGTITARYPGHMIHIDVKKVGKIPDGGGWKVHGRDSDAARSSKRGKGRRVGYTHLHSAIDGFSRLAYIEPLEDETAATTTGFLHRAFAFFAAHGITRITRLVSDNGPNYRSNAFARSIRGKVSRHQRTRAYTPRHNGKVERFQRVTADEFLYAEAFNSEMERRERHGIWLHHYKLPSAPHRLRRSASGLPPPRRRRQRHDQLHSDEEGMFSVGKLNPDEIEVLDTETARGNLLA